LQLPCITGAAVGVLAFTFIYHRLYVQMMQPPRPAPLPSAAKMASAKDLAPLPAALDVTTVVLKG